MAGQIVIKVTTDGPPRVAERVAKHVERTLGAAAAHGLAVTPVFPGVTKGRRAGMYTIELAGAPTSAEVESLVEALRGDAALEYAAIPAVKAARSAAR
jgi:hypothetical protein